MVDGWRGRALFARGGGVVGKGRERLLARVARRGLRFGRSGRAVGGGSEFAKVGEIRSDLVGWVGFDTAGEGLVFSSFLLSFFFFACARCQ